MQYCLQQCLKQYYCWYNHERDWLTLLISAVVFRSTIFVCVYNFFWLKIIGSHRYLIIKCQNNNDIHDIITICSPLIENRYLL